MSSLGLAVILQGMILAPGTDTYSEAYRATAKTGRPMVVMVSAEWCPACKTMEKNVIPQIKKRGKLSKVSFAVVDLDREQKLGRKLTRGGLIPQLLMYRKTRSGWRLRRLTGGHSLRKVEAFIEEGLKSDAAAKESETPKEAAKDQNEPANRTADATESQPASKPLLASTG
ncbi:MAG: thioredoxin family protein [Planctomycetes bacterium]|nr:thioredoxin family protein [Planctomycetota bacterium]